MWSQNINREGFVDLLVQAGAAPYTWLLGGFPRQPDYPPKGDDLWAVWPGEKERSRELPSLIVVADDRLDDFLAWAATFFDSFRPFTAYFRVIDWHQFQDASDAENRGPLRSVEPLIGIVLAEALTQARSRHSIERMPLHGFGSLVSYVLARACFVGWRDIGGLLNAWERFQRGSDSPGRFLSAQDAMGVWFPVYQVAFEKWTSKGMSGSEATIALACSELWETGDVSIDVLERLSQGHPLVQMLRNGIDSRERQVGLFHELAHSLSNRLASLEAGSFLFGYAVSKIGDGSLAHADLLFPFLDRFRTSLLWYGYCAGCRRGSPMLHSFGGLGYRVLRDLARDEALATRPLADISASELGIISRGSQFPEEIRYGSSSSVVIELAPRITGVFRSSPKGAAQTTLPLVGLDQEQVHTLKKTAKLLEELAALNDDLLSTVEGSPSREVRRKAVTRRAR